MPPTVDLGACAWLVRGYVTERRSGSSLRIGYREDLRSMVPQSVMIRPRILCSSCILARDYGPPGTFKGLTRFDEVSPRFEFLLEFSADSVHRCLTSRIRVYLGLLRGFTGFDEVLLPFQA